MIASRALPALTSRGQKLDLSPEAFGELSETQWDLGDDPEILRHSIEENGYVLLRGFLSEDEVLDARRFVLDRMASEGILDPEKPLMEGWMLPGGPKIGTTHRFSVNNAPLMKVLYQGRMMDLFEQYLGGPILHFDYTWFRATAPGLGTYPHCDIVYMGRGTPRLHTAWTPLGNISLELGGLIILEDSHRKSDRIRKYLSMDVDTYCTNRPEGEQVEQGLRPGHRAGWLSTNPVTLREKIGGRWLTTEYAPGDLLFFGMNLIHGSLDNQTQQVRLSSDSRYQLASEPADDRWIGENPPGHSKAGWRGRVC